MDPHGTARLVVESCGQKWLGFAARGSKKFNVPIHLGQIPFLNLLFATCRSLFDLSLANTK